jgi:toxin HigB-1
VIRRAERPPGLGLSSCGNITTVIRSFGNRLAEDIFDDRRTSAARRLQPSLYRAARRKVLYLHDAEGRHDLRVPPGNRLALKGDRAGWYSIRINDQWRVVFRWEAGQALDVSVVDYH